MTQSQERCPTLLNLFLCQFKKKKKKRLARTKKMVVSITLSLLPKPLMRQALVVLPPCSAQIYFPFICFPMLHTLLNLDRPIGGNISLVSGRWEV
jgi:hypothetical protein